MESCANCEKPIGNLERSFEWKGSNVCRVCFDELRRPDAASKAAALSPLQEGEIRCPNPNCGATISPVWREKGNPGVFIVLLLIGIIPGVLYAIFCMGKEWFCPACKGILQPPPEVKMRVLRNARIKSSSTPLTNLEPPR